MKRILDAVFGRWFWVWMIPLYTVWYVIIYWGSASAAFFTLLGFFGTMAGFQSALYQRKSERLQEKPATARFVNIPSAQKSTIGHAVAPQGVYFEYSDGKRYENLPTVFERWDTNEDGDPIAMFEVIPPRDPDEDRPISIGAAVWPGLTGLVLPVLKDRENPDAD